MAMKIILFKKTLIVFVLFLFALTVATVSAQQEESYELYGSAFFNDILKVDLTAEDIEILRTTEPISYEDALTELSPEELAELDAEIANGKNLLDITSYTGNANCFDYYKFGSVQIPINPVLLSTIPGTNMTFSGVITNENDYPVVDGSVYVKIFKIREGEVKSENGHDVVDQFFVKKNVVIAANESIPIEFDWVIPAWSESGTYQAATFFVTSDKYNLLGLSFTDDVVGNTASFDVVADGSAIKYAAFDKDSVVINGFPYAFAAYPPSFDKDEPIELSFDVSNNSKQDKELPVTINVYAWDAMSEDNLIQKTEGAINSVAETVTPVQFVLDDTSHRVYLIEIILEDSGTKSILNVRVSREGISKLRINFPAVTKYPLVAGEQVEVFSCVHNTAEIKEDARVVLTLFDGAGNTLHEFEYSGDVNENMAGVVSSFVPQKTFTTFSLQTDLYQNGTLVESETVKYDCEDFNSCEESSTEGITFSESEKIIMAAMGVIVLVIIVLLVLFFTKKKVVTNNVTY